MLTISRRVFAQTVFAAVPACFLAHAHASEPDRLVLHEWGTFTVLQDENGKAIRGVNVNEESLPEFVHHLDHRLVADLDAYSPFRGRFAKALPSGYPAALMRMETPIIYLYPPGNVQGDLNVDVSIGFRGGWISEWYPNAEVTAPGFKPKARSIGALTPQTRGQIQWRNLLVHSDSTAATAEIPETGKHVWLAPRIADAATVSTSKRESERYLFYRGIANRQAPLCVRRDQQHETLVIQLNQHAVKQPVDTMHYPRLVLRGIHDYRKKSCR